jgi:hypothetical protein
MSDKNRTLLSKTVNALAILNPTPDTVLLIPKKGYLTGAYVSGKASTFKVVSMFIRPETRMSSISNSMQKAINQAMIESKNRIKVKEN